LKSNISYNPYDAKLHRFEVKIYRTPAIPKLTQQ
jgi:hypothetical protein